MSSGVRRIIAPYITTISVHYLRFDRPPTEIKQPMNILLLKIEDLMTEELTYEATHAITAHWCQSGSWTTVYGNLINAMYVFSHGSFHTHTHRERARKRERCTIFSRALSRLSLSDLLLWFFLAASAPDTALHDTSHPEQTPEKGMKGVYADFSSTSINFGPLER